MPPLKDPPKLLDIAITGIGSYVSHFTGSVATITHQQTAALLSHSNEKRRQKSHPANQIATQIIEECMEYLENAIFSCVPSTLTQVVFEKILSTLAESLDHSKVIFRRTYGHHQSSWQSVQVTLAFSRIIANTRVKKLDLTNVPKSLKDELKKHLSLFDGLEDLNFGAGSGDGFRQVTFMSLKYLVNLRRLSLTADCQNEHLAVVAQNCPKLESLDISNSTSITDDGITWLLLCSNLKHLNLDKTSVSVGGYAKLLLGLANLLSLGRSCNFGQVLELIHNSSSAKRRFALNYFHSNDLCTNEHLKLLVSMCPDLRHVNLYVDEDMDNALEPLASLVNLQELKLLACNFYSDSLDKLLEVKGSSLTLLYLEHVDEIDMAALTCIATNCPHLKSLTLFSCDFVENFGESFLDRRFSTEPFPRLEHLVCVSESAPNVIEFLLVHATHLKTIRFGSTAWFNDETVANVVSRGALRHIREIRILRSFELTMTAVDTLINECPQLQVLAEMDSWEGISAEDLCRLRQRIRADNLNLDTSLAWTSIRA